MSSALKTLFAIQQHALSTVPYLPRLLLNALTSPARIPHPTLACRTMHMNHSVVPLPQKWPKISPKHDRYVFSDTSTLHGRPAKIKTCAQLSLENVLQDLQRAKATSHAAQVRTGLIPNPNDNKFRDSKPRLLLMGLRRYGQSCV